ncbi:hypothetical protein DB347_12005 [Opitutaceae bacterium EW11]|nr:hypothetical protein DB347_12005 [Opitutaceae bacterium EW11]
MKPLALLCGVSLVANATLAAFLLGKPAARTGTADSLSPAGIPSAASKAPGRNESEKTAAKTNTESGKLWDGLATESLPSLVARLRTEGFPPSVVRSIVAGLLSEKYSARKKEILAKQQEIPFWRSGSFRYDAKTMAAIRQISREQRDEMKALLGADASELSGEALAYMKMQYGDLAPEKIEQIQSITSDYGEMRSEIYSNSNGLMLPEDNEKLALLRKEQRADLAALLSPAEIEEMELRSSDLSNQLRFQLGTFKPTEQEFRWLYRTLRAAQEQGGADLLVGGGLTNPSSQVRSTLLAQAEKELPADRLAELKQNLDPAYQMANRLVARLDLPTTAAVELVSIQQDIQNRAATLRRDRNLSSDERNAQLSALNQEATSRLTQTLTPRGLEAYKRYGGGWLQSLQPRPTPPGTKPQG